MSIGRTWVPPTAAEDWNHGSCDIMAVALHRHYGLPMAAEFEWGRENGVEVLGYLVHAWVRLPDGRMLDAAGIGEPWVQSEGGDPNDDWVEGYRVVDLTPEDPHLLLIREETDYRETIQDMRAIDWIEENLSPILTSIGIDPVTPSEAGPGR